MGRKQSEKRKRARIGFSDILHGIAAFIVGQFAALHVLFYLAIANLLMFVINLIVFREGWISQVALLASAGILICLEVFLLYRAAVIVGEERDYRSGP